MIPVAAAWYTRRPAMRRIRMEELNLRCEQNSNLRHGHWTYHPGGNTDYFGNRILDSHEYTQAAILRQEIFELD